MHAQVFPTSGVLAGTGPIANLDNSGTGFDSPYQKWTVSADFTYYKTGWKGSHEVQFGVYGQPLIRIESSQLLPANGVVLQEEVLRNAANPAGGTIPFHRQTYSLTSYTDTALDSSDYAFYVQDSWRPAARITVTAGLRADIISRTDKLFDVTVQDTTAIGPRLGVNYMLTADNRNALRASWGRVHETLAQNIETAGTNIAGVRDEFDTDLNGSLRDRVRVAVEHGAREQPQARHGPQAAAGRRVHGRLPPPVALADGVRRELPAPGVPRPDRVRGSNGIYTGGVFSGYKDPTQNQIYLVTENTWNWPVYNGLEFQVARQGRAFQMIGSLSRQWRHIAGDWQPNDPASFIQPGAFPNDMGIGATKGAVGDANSLSGSSQARAQVWRDYSANVTASYLTPGHPARDELLVPGRPLVRPHRHPRSPPPTPPSDPRS